MATSIEAVRVLANTMLKILTRATEKTKRSWTYMRENRMDSPYLFLHWGFSIVASHEHPELMLEKKVQEVSTFAARFFAAESLLVLVSLSLSGVSLRLSGLLA